MSRYAISDLMCQSLPQELKAYMSDLDHFFCGRDALAAAVDKVKGASKGNLQACLTVISNATLGWGKPFERLSLEEFMSPRDAGGTMISSMSRRTVVRALAALKAAKLIVHFKSPCGRAVHYGLNVKMIFERIGNIYAAAPASCSKSQISKNMWERLSTSKLIDTFAKFISNFAEKIIHDIEEVKKILKKGGKVVGTLLSGVKAAKKKAREHSDMKGKAKADQPFFKENGTPNAAAALEYWHRAVKDSEYYVTYTPIRTAKALGMMKHWLNECAKDGLTEEKIRWNITQYVRRWEHVEDDDRSFTALSSKGKPYEVRMVPSPDFEFFYANRSQLALILMRACEPGMDIHGEPRKKCQWLF